MIKLLQVRYQTWLCIQYFINTITYFVAGRDFIASSGVLTFGPGVTEKKIEVTVINDNVYEGLQEFYAELSTNEMQVNIFQTDAMAQIVDDDGKLIMMYIM